MRQLVRPLILAAVVALVFSGCSAAGGSGVPGKWGSTATGQPHLTISSDGTFSGSDGCNNLAGKGTISGSDFTFGPFASTLKACEGVHPWLNQAVTATVDGDVLTVKNHSGAKIGTLDRR